MKSIAVCSGKGSPGATFVSINLASALCSHGHEALLIDLDPHGGDIAGYLGLDPRKGLYPLGVLGRSDYSAEDLRAEIEVRGGVPCIAGFPKETSLEATLLRQIFSSASSGNSLAIADIGRIDGRTVEVARDADLVVVVVRPDLISIHGAQRAKEILLGAGVPDDRMKVLVNGWEWRRVADVAETADAVSIPSLGMVPLDRRAVRKALQAQLPIQKGRAVKAFRGLAARLTESEVEATEEAEVAVA